MTYKQVELLFDDVLAPDDHLALWTPREIWVRLTQRLMMHFAEGRRVEYKGNKKVNFDDFATYLSTFSNTVDGGVLVFGATSEGAAEGCSKLSPGVVNRIESCHLNLCCQARPEYRNIPVVVDNKQDFCIAVYIPYIGKLVETNRGEAYVRYGDNRHLMSDEEKRDFKSTRQERAFEIDVAHHIYPEEFDLRIVQDFCDAYRARENRPNWSNEDVLSDRQLGTKMGSGFFPYNNLVLIAGRNPGRTIPGCRVRVQRFAELSEGMGGSTQEYSPIRDKYIEGNIISILREADTLINETIYPVTWLDKTGRFVTTPEYPKWAWFEALVNALVHRSYSFSGTEITVKFFPDRAEIESPGAFVPPVTEKTIYTARAARNHHMMDAIRYLGYVQMAREGARRIKTSMEEWGLPAPVFKQEPIHGIIVRVTLWNDHQTRKRSTDRDVASYVGVDVWKRLQQHEVLIIGFAYRNKVIQVSEASRLTGRTWHTSKKDLNRLARAKLLLFVPGDYERDPKAHYRIREEDNV